MAFIINRVNSIVVVALLSSLTAHYTNKGVFKHEVTSIYSLLFIVKDYSLSGFPISDASIILSKSSSTLAFCEIF